jgi:hypothetical protein
MEDTNKELIEGVLKKSSQDIEFEPIPEENAGPLAQPVVNKNTPASDVPAAKNETQQNNQSSTQGPKQEQQVKEEFSDAPEQEFEEPTEEEKQEKTGQESGEFSMPLEHAQLMADSIIGTINNTVLEVGGGYFVTISKHKDFYDFEEIIQVIDEQNVKNIKRLKLDEEDKALLRPLLVHILRKKSAALSPEKQLLMVALSILIKKAKVVMEIRAENEMLVERIRDIIRKEVRAAREEQEERAKERQEEQSEEASEINEENRTEVEETVYEEVIQPQQHGSGTGLPDEVLETYK